MDKDLSDSDLDANQDIDSSQSLVDKLKKNVSEIINNTPLSKWFGRQGERETPNVRRRQEDSDDEDLQELQPPAKRSKLPPTKETISLNVSEVVSPITVNNTYKAPYRSFPEPVAGPSGYQMRKMLHSTKLFNDNATSVKSTDDGVFKNPKNVPSFSGLRNKDCHSDSEESTSGYSSGRVGSKEVVSQESSKQTSPSEISPRKTRSLFQGSNNFLSDGSGTSTQNSSLSSRAPSFNPSTFGSSTFTDRTLSSKRILNSPFYNGRTIYGGASAYGRHTKRTAQDLQRVLRKSVNIKPINTGLERGNVQLGKTARKILDTLEQYSSPISDAKKIPVASKRPRSEGSLAKYIGANPYSFRESRSASNKELLIPTVVVSSKRKLQNSTEAVRQIATKSSSNSYQMPVHRETEKHVTKIKTKITSVRQKVQVEEAVPEVNLTPISLPIKDLPKFDIPWPATSQKAPTSSIVSVIPSNSSSTAAVEPILKTLGEPVISPVKETTNKTKSPGKSPSLDLSEFEFSAPLILAQCIKPLKSLNNFKFSEPLVKKRRSIHPELDSQDKSADSLKAKKNNGENVTANIMDNVMEKFKPKEGTWECSACLIRNQADKVKCVACETPKAKSSSRISNVCQLDSRQAFTTPLAFTCMIRNNEQKCTVCKSTVCKCEVGEEKRPKKSANPISKSTAFVPNSTGFSSNGLTPTPLSMSTALKFDPKFTASVGTWECTTCMIRNKDEVNKCVACETPNPKGKAQEGSSSFGASFKKKEDEWECQVCMVRNKGEMDKCQCCETANPNKSAEELPQSSKVSKFNFGIDKATAQSFSFGIPAAALEKMEKAPDLVGNLFGEKKQEASGATPTFTFGIPRKTDQTDSEPKKDLSNSTTNPKKTTFSFGSSPAAAPAAVPSASAAPSFQFGTQQKKSDDSGKNGPPAFSFKSSASKSEVAASSTNVAPTFSFGAATAKFGETEKEKVEERVNPLLKPGEKLPEKAEAAPSSFSFGLSKVPSSTSLLPNAMAAGAVASSNDQSPNKRSKPSGEAQVPAKTPMFAFKSPTTNGDLNKPLSENKPAAGSGGFNFSFSAPKPEAAVVAPSFGSSLSGDTSKQATFKFGQSSEPAKSANGFSFSGGAKSSADFSFGGPKPASQATFAAPAAAAKQEMFSFGSSGMENKPPTFTFNAPPSSGTTTTSFKSQSTFGFGQTPATAATPPFNFAGAQKKEQSGFGAPSSFGTANHNSSNNNQGTPFEGSTGQNAAVNGTFNFGASAASNNKAVFSFGAVSANNTSAAAGGFNFGSSTVNTGAPASTGGFNFSSSAPTFDGTVTPNFNFTGNAGPTTFSAAPLQDGGTMAQRKIRRAVRRTAR